LCCCLRNSCFLVQSKETPPQFKWIALKWRKFSNKRHIDLSSIFAKGCHKSFSSKSAKNGWECAKMDGGRISCFT
jgi:hypothetical protein